MPYPLPWTNSKLLDIRPKEEAVEAEHEAPRQSYETGDEKEIDYADIKRAGMLLISRYRYKRYEGDRLKTYDIIPKNDPELADTKKVHPFYGDAPDFLSFTYVRDMDDPDNVFYNIDQLDLRGEKERIFEGQRSWPFSLY